MPKQDAGKRKPASRPAKKLLDDDKAESRRLARADWAAAALRQIAESGLAGVNIATLATRLRVTTGSFYWHFASRTELIEVALDRWETERIDIIEKLREISDPRARLERLVSDIYRNQDRGALFAAMQASASDPRVASRLRRTTQRRLTFLTQTYRELGYPMAKARHSALVLYSLYTGLWEVVRTLPASDEHAVVGDRMTDYVQHLRALVLPPKKR